MKLYTLIAAILVACLTHQVQAVQITGDPSVDSGWAFGGNSLGNGDYVRGNANVSFDMYTTEFTVTDSSQFDITGHTGAFYDNYYRDRPAAANQWDQSTSRSWDVGHTVIGVGGVFTNTTAGDAGWAAFTGNAVNSLIDGEERIRLQAKIGTATSTWSASTVAPGAGNGSGSTNDGGSGRLFVRSSGWLGDDGDGSAWITYSDVMMGMQEPGHITRDTTVGVDAARIIWNWDGTNGRPASWQILVNTSLVDMDAAVGFAGLLPVAGDPVISSIQVTNGPFTDALATIVPIPEPTSLALLGMSSLALLFRRNRR